MADFSFVSIIKIIWDAIKALLGFSEIHTREPEYPDPNRNVPGRHEFLQCKISGTAKNEVDEMSRP